MRLGSLMLGTWLVVMGGLAPAAGAATFTVDSEEDSVDAQVGDGLCATAAGACSLRAAVQELNASAPGGSIDVPAGEYVLEIPPGPDAGDAATGSLDVTFGTITGAGRDVTIVDGGGLDDVFAIVDGAISGLTVRNGARGIVRTDFGHDQLQICGVLVNANAAEGIFASNLVLRDSEVNENGGVGVRTGGNFPSLESSVVRDNGGRGVECLSETLWITDSRISGNDAVGDGGGVAAEVQFLNIIHSVIINNTATGNGGGVAQGVDLDLSPSSNRRAVDRVAVVKLQIVDSVVNNNRADGDGGGVYAFDGLQLERSDVSRNHAGGAGGGLWVGNGAAEGLFVIASTISHNDAAAGGGIVKQVRASQPMVIKDLVNTTVANNRARDDGGGILTRGDGVAFGLHNVTIAGNVADDDRDGFGDGGGIFTQAVFGELPYDGPVAALASSILSDNVDRGGEAPDCGGTVRSYGFNLVGSADGCVVDGDLSGTIIGAASHLGLLQDNGGPTTTMALLAGSPAIDAGNPAGCTDHEGAPLTRDQRGVTRPQGPGCDMGAFEDRCGNGVVEGREACDDGNSLDGDCCSAECQLEPAGSSCDDGNPCTVGDACNAGTCATGAKEIECGPCETCSATLGCVVGPRPQCLHATKRTADDLEIADKGVDARDQLTWTWTKGEAISRAEIGDPTNGEGYALCLFDESGPAPSLLFKALSRQGQCGKKPCWRSLNKTTVKYKDGERLLDGLETVVLKAGATGKSKVRVAAKGDRLDLPVLPLRLPLRAQLQAVKGPCWEARYLESGIVKNTTTQLKAKASPP